MKILVDEQNQGRMGTELRRKLGKVILISGKAIL